MEKAVLDAELFEYRAHELESREAYERVYPDYVAAKYTENSPMVKYPMYLGQSIGIGFHNRFSMPDYHTHDYVEVMYVYSGTFSNIIEGKPLVMNTGDICIMPPFVYHAVDVIAEPDKRHDTALINIFVKADKFRKMLEPLRQNADPLYEFASKLGSSASYPKYCVFYSQGASGNNDSEKIMSMIIESHFKDENGFQLKKLSLLQALIAHAIESDGYKTEIASELVKESTDINGILEYIVKNFRTVSPESLAAGFGYSQNYISKLIKRRTGVKFCDLVIDLKFDNALKLLCESEMSISSVAFDSGFECIEHFHRSFKRRYGMTPGEYRNCNKI